MPDRVTLTLFTPGEAERITGVTNETLRNWRRRGHMKSQAGHARFDVFGLADMWTLKMLSDRGLDLADAVQGLDTISPRLAWHALAWRNAWDGEVAAAPGDEWGDKSLWLRREVMFITPARFAVRLADGRVAYATSLDSLLDRFSSADPAVSSALILFDLQALGTLLLERAGRPLAHFDLDPSE